MAPFVDQHLKIRGLLGNIRLKGQCISVLPKKERQDQFRGLALNVLGMVAGLLARVVHGEVLLTAEWERPVE
jgi:hypothetical protein